MWGMKLSLIPEYSSPERGSGLLVRLGTLVLALLGLYPQYSALHTILAGVRGVQVHQNHSAIDLLLTTTDYYQSYY